MVALRLEGRRKGAEHQGTVKRRGMTVLKADCRGKRDPWEVVWGKAHWSFAVLDKLVEQGRPQVWSQKVAGLEWGRILQFQQKKNKLRPPKSCGGAATCYIPGGGGGLLPG